MCTTEMLGDTAYIWTNPASLVSGVIFMNATGCVAPLWFSANAWPAYVKQHYCPRYTHTNKKSLLISIYCAQCSLIFLIFLLSNVLWSKQTCFWRFSLTSNAKSIMLRYKHTVSKNKTFYAWVKVGTDIILTWENYMTQLGGKVL